MPTLALLVYHFIVIWTHQSSNIIVVSSFRWCSWLVRVRRSAFVSSTVHVQVPCSLLLLPYGTCTYKKVRKGWGVRLFFYGLLYSPYYLFMGGWKLDMSSSGAHNTHFQTLLKFENCSCKNDANSKSQQSFSFPGFLVPIALCLSIKHHHRSSHRPSF